MFFTLGERALLYFEARHCVTHSVFIPCYTSCKSRLTQRQFAYTMSYAMQCQCHNGNPGRARSISECDSSSTFSKYVATLYTCQIDQSTSSTINLHLSNLTIKQYNKLVLLINAISAYLRMSRTK